MINLMSPNVVIPNLVYNVYIILKKWTRLLGHAVHCASTNILDSLLGAE